MADPLYINADAVSGTPEYDAAELRRAMASVLFNDADRFGARFGVRPGNGDAVTLASTTVTVENCVGVAYPGLTTLSGPYWWALQSVALALAPADASNPRKDIVVMQIQDDDEDSSGFRRARAFIVTGQASPTPTEPALPTGSFRMATVDVPVDGGGSPTLTYNAPFYSALGGVCVVRNDAELPGGSGGLYDGALRWRQDTQALEVHDGISTWRELVGIKSPRGFVDYKEFNTDVLVSGDGNVIHGSITFTAGSTRHYKIDIQAQFEAEANANDGIMVPKWNAGGSVGPTDPDIGGSAFVEPTGTNANTQIGGVWHAPAGLFPDGQVTVGVAFRSAAGDSITAKKSQLYISDMGGI